MTLFDQITEFENLYNAYLEARRCKRYRSSILKFSYHLENNLLTLQQELKDKSYHHGGYREFVVIDSKKRLIKAPLFRDRVVHHALCRVIEPILDRGFIYDSYACRKNKGTHAAVKRLEKFLQSCNNKTKNISQRTYCLKCDISKYFDNIDHEILIKILHRKIADENVLWLLSEIINSNLQGIPIGNLTSQLFANVYLNEFDHFVKRELHEKYYIRYMDDFLLLSNSKQHLREIKESIRMFLMNRLKLKLHPQKSEIFPIENGIDFLGYVILNHRRLLRKSTVRRFLKKKRRYALEVAAGKRSKDSFRNVLVSWQGYISFADSSNLKRSLCTLLNLQDNCLEG